MTVGPALSQSAGPIYFAAIALTQGKWAIVDLEDFERASSHKWRASLDSRGTKYYAKRRRKVAETDWRASQIRLHHFVLDVRPESLEFGYVVDHKNHDSLDCRKENLEIITQAENMSRSPGWRKNPSAKRKD